MNACIHTYLNKDTNICLCIMTNIYEHSFSPNKIMFANTDKPQDHVVPSAPGAAEDFQRGPPPPSYEESLKNSETTSYLHTTQYTIPSPYQQQPFNYQATYLAPGSSSVHYGYANPYQTHIQQQHSFYNTLSTAPPTAIPQASKNVLYLAKGAKLRATASGGISIPPPPPGCAPTSGQMAALSGQPVLVKKQKRSFF